MNTISFETPITEDGDFTFPAVTPGSKNILELSGDFGGGTATIGYISPTGNFIAYKISTGGDDVTTDEEESWILNAPSSGRYAISLSGSTSPSLTLKVTRAQ